MSAYSAMSLLGAGAGAEKDALTGGRTRASSRTGITQPKGLTHDVVQRMEDRWFGSITLLDNLRPQRPEATTKTP
jgi:hypothetical protein